MSIDIVVTLPDNVLKQAEWLADRSGRPVAELLAETIELALTPVEIEDSTPVADLSDDEVIALADSQMSETDDERLSELLDRQQQGNLSESERTELTALMHLYQRGLVRKAEALREAVHRRLREPLAP